MTGLTRDTSRDPRIEVPSNHYVIHAAAHRLLPMALRGGISANAVSVAGLVLGALAALACYHWRLPFMASVGFALALGWMVCDGLDGMIARATGTASALGRVLDGLCDHGVFLLLYVAAAWSVGTPEAWLLATAAGVVHAVQSNAYEGERTRFHRRLRSDPGATPPARTGFGLERLYDFAAGWLDRAAAPFDRRLAASADPAALGRIYAARAVAPLRAMIPLSANTRVVALYIAMLVGEPRLWWWFELVPLTLLAVGAILWHRRVEHRFAAQITPAHASS